MKFVIPQCNNETVSLAQEYLDRAPESVLAIAAQRATPDSSISLKDWPDANVAVLQVGTRAVIEAIRHSLPTSLLEQLLLLNGVFKLLVIKHVYTGHQLPV